VCARAARGGTPASALGPPAPGVGGRPGRRPARLPPPSPRRGRRRCCAARRRATEPGGSAAGSRGNNEGLLFDRTYWWVNVAALNDICQYLVFRLWLVVY
jgi:hypothetical protein